MSNPQGSQKRKRPGPEAQDTLQNPRLTFLLRLDSNNLRNTEGNDTAPSTSTQTTLIQAPVFLDEQLRQQFLALQAEQTVQNEQSSGTIQRRKAYTWEFKLAAISRLEQDGISKYELGRIIGVDASMLTRWLNQKQAILESKTGTYKKHSGRKVEYDELQKILYDKFWELRGPAYGVKVRRSWFLAQAKLLFEELYPECVSLDSNGSKVYHFCFPRTWFYTFKERKDIASRAITNVAQKIPEDHRLQINNFHVFIRRQALQEGFPMQDFGIFKLENVSNLDQTPLQFEFLDGKTYDHKGAKTVHVRSKESGLEKRQCTVQLTISAHDSFRIKPLIISPGVETKIMKSNKAKLWDSRVTVRFQPNAWADETIMVDYLKKLWTPAVALNPGQFTVGNKEPRMLLLDVQKALKTDKFKAAA